MSRKRRPEWMTVVEGSQSRRPPRARSPKAKRVVAPGHLTEHAAKAWALFEPFLREMGVFSPETAVALERCCELYAETIELRGVLQDQGRYYQTTNRDGHVMIRPHPAAGQLADTDRRLASYLSEFGLTPAGRAKLLGLKAGASRTRGKQPNGVTDTAAEFFG